MEPATIAEPETRGLRRCAYGRLVAGVAAGLAGYFDVDVVLVRIVFVVLTLMGGIGVPLYAAAWLLVPEEGADESLLEDILGHGRSETRSRPAAAPATDPGQRSSDGVPQ